MCLYTCHRIEPKEDITCYKIVVTYKNIKDTYGSPFHVKRWRLGETCSIPKHQYETEPVVKYFKKGWQGSFSMIKGAAFHTYKRQEDAIYVLSMFRNNVIVGMAKERDRYVLAKCTIPKNSKYIFEGECSSPYITQPEGYASEQLRVDEIIDVTSELEQY